MAVFSIIQKSQLEGAKRLDAEYYQPEYFIDFTKGNWQPIGDCLSMCQYGLSLAMNDKGIGYPMFKMDNIDNGFLLNDDVRYANVPKSLFDEFKLKKNDIFFNRVNSEEFVGRTGINKMQSDAVFASYLIRILPKSGGAILPDYLNIFLNSSFGIRQIRKFARRAVNQANVNAEELKQIKIAVLSLNFQKEVEKKSNESWNLIVQSKSLYSQAENLLFEELGLKDFEEDESLFWTTDLPEAKTAGRMDAEYFQPKYEKLVSKIQKHNAKPLDDLVVMKKGFEPGSEKYEEEGKLFIRVSNVTKHGLVDGNQKYIGEELYEKLNKDFEPKIEEILLTKDATPGVAYVLKDRVEGIIAGGILRLRLKNEIEPEYLALCINSVLGQMQVERDAGGSIIAHWRPDQIKALQIPILPDSTQRKVVELVQKSYEARRKSKELLAEAKRKVEELIESKSK